MQWYDTDKGRQRLQNEMELLTIDFPQMKFGLLDDGTAFVAGYIQPTSDCLTISYYVVAVYPYGYPNGNRIKVYAPYEKFRSGVPHLYRDQELCLEHGDFNRDDTICTVIGWAIQWLVLYENFLRTR